MNWLANWVLYYVLRFADWLIHLTEDKHIMMTPEDDEEKGKEEKTPEPEPEPEPDVKEEEPGGGSPPQKDD